MVVFSQLTILEVFPNHNDSMVKNNFSQFQKCKDLCGKSSELPYETDTAKAAGDIEEGTAPKPPRQSSTAKKP